MTSRIHIAVVAVALALAAACSGANPSYCDADRSCSGGRFCDIAGDFGPPNSCIAAPDDDVCSATNPCEDGARPLCSPDHMCVACLENADCPITVPVCSASFECLSCDFGDDGDAVCAAREADAPYCAAEGSCEECLTNSQCPSEAPVCSDKYKCVACSIDEDCESRVCDLEAGQCVTASDILYVAEDGNNIGSCDFGSPCKTLSRAVQVATPQRFTIHVDGGEYDEVVTVNGGGALRIVGADGPKITGRTEVLDDGALSLRSLDFRGTGTNADGSAIGCNGQNTQIGSVVLRDIEVREYESIAIAMQECTAELVDVRVVENMNRGISASAGTMTLRRVLVTGNQQLGVITEGVQLLIQDSEISDNSQGGLLTDLGRTEVNRTKILGNEGIGILIYSSDFVLRNSWIADNGGAGTIGGLEFQTQGGEKELQFNTFANNTNGSATQEVVCDTDSGTVLENSIVVTNGIVDVDCEFRYSLTSTLKVGLGNVVGTSAIFKSAGSGNYHLVDDAPAIDAADPAATLKKDIDGDPRPQGEAPDMGADEWVP